MDKYRIVYENNDFIDLEAINETSVKVIFTRMNKEGYGSLILIDLDRKKVISFKSENNRKWVKMSNPQYIDTEKFC